MRKRKTARGNDILPSYIVRRQGRIESEGYTLRELIRGLDDDGRALPCPECGKKFWLGGYCLEDRSPYPCLPYSQLTRTELVELIETLV